MSALAVVTPGAGRRKARASRTGGGLLSAAEGRLGSRAPGAAGQTTQRAVGRERARSIHDAGPRRLQAAAQDAGELALGRTVDVTRQPSRPNASAGRTSTPGVRPQTLSVADWVRLFRTAVADVLYRCYAKINLTLEIIGKRPDGFHELASLVHTVSLADELRASRQPSGLRTRVEGLDIDPSSNLCHARRPGSWPPGLRTPPGAEHQPGQAHPARPRAWAAAPATQPPPCVGLNALWGAASRQPVRSQMLAARARLRCALLRARRGGADARAGRRARESCRRASASGWCCWCRRTPSPTRPVDSTPPSSRRDFSDGALTLRAAERLRKRQGAAASASSSTRSSAPLGRSFPGLDELWHAAEGRRTGASVSRAQGRLCSRSARHRDEARATVGRPSRSLGRKVYVLRTVKHARASLRRTAIGYA